MPKKTDILKVEVYKSKWSSAVTYYVYRNVYLDGVPFRTHKYTSDTVPKTVLNFMSKAKRTQFGTFLDVYTK